MIKFRVTGQRIAEPCSIMDYMLLSVGHIGTVARLSPRFVVDEQGNYIVNIITDADGDIEKIENEPQALLRMSAVTPKRLEKLAPEFMEAVKNIVNPPSARD